MGVGGLERKHGAEVVLEAQAAGEVPGGLAAPAAGAVPCITSQASAGDDAPWGPGKQGSPRLAGAPWGIGPRTGLLVCGPRGFNALV